MRRESAASVLRRFRAPPVSFGAEALDRGVLDGGLRAGQLAVIVGASATGKTEWLYRLAARSIVAGSRVAWVACCCAFNLRRFVALLENALCEAHSVVYSLLAPTLGGAEALKQKLEELLGRMTVARPSTPRAALATLLFGAIVPEGPNSAQRADVVIVDGLGLWSFEAEERAVEEPAPVAEALAELRRRAPSAATVASFTTLPWKESPPVPMQPLNAVAVLRLSLPRAADGGKRPSSSSSTCAGCAQGVPHTHREEVHMAATLQRGRPVPVLVFACTANGVRVTRNYE